MSDEVGVVQAYFGAAVSAGNSAAEAEPVGSKAQQLMKLARKIQADRGWDLTRAWTEASRERIARQFRQVIQRSVSSSK
jgi:hypothetical protein